MQRSLFVHLSVSLLAIAAAVAGMVGVASGASGTSPWNEFDILLVSGEADLPDLHRRLLAAGERPLDLTNASVRIEDFNGQAEVLVAELGQRFDEADPRIDPFLTALPDLFSLRRGDSTYSVIYLPRIDSSARRYRTIRNALSPIPHHLPGKHVLLYVISAAITTVVVILSVFILRSRPLLGLAVASLAGGYVLLYGVEGVLRSGLTALAALYVFRGNRDIEREWLLHRGMIRLRDHHRRTYLFLGAVVVSSFLMIFLDQEGVHGADSASYSFYLAALTGIYALAVILRNTTLSRNEHPLFSPQPILCSPWRQPPPATVLFPGLPVTLLALLLGFGSVYLYGHHGVTEDEIYVPVPEHRILEPQPPETPEEGEGFLAAIAGSDPVQDPLSTAGFLAHRRYQSSLLYDGVYELPAPNEIVTIQRFRRTPDGRIEEWRDERVRFDGAWLLAELDVPDAAVYSLFSREGGVFSVVRQQLTLGTVSPEKILTQLILVLLVILPVLISYRLPYRSGIGTVAIASRSEQHRA